MKDSWSIEEGLPQITALAMEQDAEGFLWVATQAGLARFDGIRFTAFSPENTPEIPGLFSNDLYLDSHDRLWVATYKGVAVHENRRFRRVPLIRPPAVEESIDARAIGETPDGQILVAAVEGLYYVEGEQLLPVAQFAGQATFALMPQNQAMLVGGVGKVFRFEDGVKSAMLLPPGEENALVTHLVRAQGVLWAGTSHGLFWWDNDGDGPQWRRFDSRRETEAILAGQPIDALYEDSQHNLWVGTHQGLGRIRERELAEFVPDTDPAAHRNIRAIFEDHEGNLWLGSQWQGVARLWNGWTRRYASAYGLDDPLIWSVARGHNNELWVGTNRGLSVFRDGRFEVAIPEEDLPHPNAYTLLDDGEKIWVGTRTGMIWYADGRVLRPEVFEPLATTQVSGFLKDAHGDVWIAANNGLYRYSNGELVRYDEKDGLVEQRTRVLYETPSGRIFLGTREGLFEAQASHIRRIGHDAGLREDIDITAITQLDDGTLVVGTLSEQLFINADGEWTELTTESGLPGNSPFFMAEDSRGYLWVAGIRGLFRVPVKDLHLYRKGELPRIRAEMLLSERGDHRGSQKTYCCNGAGNAKGFMEGDTLWLPTRGGPIAVDTRDIEKNTVPSNVTVERLRYGDRWYTWRPGAPFDLPPSARDIAIDFTTLSFQQPNSVRMMYRLFGYDDQWHELENPDYRNVAYTNLPPGSYVFEARGTNNAGIWSKDHARMAFTIAPYFYETTWFRMLIAAALLGLIFAGHRYQLRHLHSQRTELERVVRQRTEELRVANKSLQEMSVTDQLTGLRNRRYLQAQLPADLAFYNRESLKSGGSDLVMVFAMADIDHFKRTNDVYGHHAGDRVLQQFSLVLQDQVRTGDYVVRWGGEEFLMVFRPMPRQESTKIAERIREAVETHEFKLEGDLTLSLTSSIGFVEYPLFRDQAGPLRWEDMVELADHALYYVKSRGRNGWAALRPTASTRIETVVDEVRLHLDALIEHGDIEIVFNLGEKVPS